MPPLGIAEPPRSLADPVALSAGLSPEERELHDDIRCTCGRCPAGRNRFDRVGLRRPHGDASYAQDQGATTQSTDPAKQDQATSNAPHAGTNAAATPLQNANPGSTTKKSLSPEPFSAAPTPKAPSPVTVVSSKSMARRGLTNISDAVRAVSADSSGSIPNAFAAGFGAGASAPSLRGLTVNSTLTLVDGHRITNYPLSDDGQRSFVDLNTMPRVSIERVEVLKDGASSTYGADAIGGVVNVIQRKTFNGLDATLEGGTSEHGGGDEYRGSVLRAGAVYERGINFYVGAEYELNKNLRTRPRFPVQHQRPDAPRRRSQPQRRPDQFRHHADGRRSSAGDAAQQQ